VSGFVGKWKRERVGETGTAKEHQGQKKIHSVVQNNTILGFFFFTNSE